MPWGFAIVALTRLVWLAGRQVIDGAQSQQEKESAYNLVATTLFKVLRVSSRNAIFDQEPDILGRETYEKP